MIVYVVKIKVKPDCIEQFIKATEANHLATRKETGNKRFDLIQNSGTTEEFLLYEVYDNEESVKAHKETAHYLAWREIVAPYMSADRIGTCYSPVFPRGEQQW